MNYPHRMRLIGPWEFDLLSVAALPTGTRSGRVRFPATWHEALGDEYRGQVRFCRRFNRPTSLDAEERVWLVIEGPHPFSALFLNDDYLFPQQSAGKEFEVEITGRLQPHNELALEFSCDGELAGNIVDDVRLEIRRAAGHDEAD